MSEIEYIKTFPKYGRDHDRVYNFLYPIKSTDSGAWYTEEVCCAHKDYEGLQIGASIDPHKWKKPSDDITPITAKTYYEVRQKAIDQMQAAQPPKEKPFDRTKFIKDTYGDGKVERAIPDPKDFPPPPLSFGQKISKIVKELLKK